MDPAYLCSEDSERTRLSASRLTCAASQNGFSRCGVYNPERGVRQPGPCLPLALPHGGGGTGPFSSLFADTARPFGKIHLGGVSQGLMLAPPEESIFSTQFPKYLVSWPFCVARGGLQGRPSSGGCGQPELLFQGCQSKAPWTRCSHDTCARSLQQTAGRKASGDLFRMTLKSRWLASSNSPKLPIQTLLRKKTHFERCPAILRVLLLSLTQDLNKLQAMMKSWP